MYRTRGDALGAARVAVALAWDAILFGDRPAVARGWLERGARLLRDQPLSPEHGWLAVREAELALHLGEPEAARAAAARASEVGRALERDDLQVVGLALDGVALVHEGEAADGMRRLGEAGVAATGGEVEDLMWIGKVCCFVIDACADTGDFERAAQWCDEVDAFARRWELRTLFAVCRTQYAGVLINQGGWREAEDELERTLADFAATRRTFLGGAVARLGELRRRQGRLDEAEALFRQVDQSVVAQVGRGAVALDRGRPRLALELAEGLLQRLPPAERPARAAALDLIVRAAAELDDVGRVGEAAAELRALAEAIETSAFRAMAAQAAGAAAAGGGDAARACAAYDEAAELFGRAGAPYQRAYARLELARLLARVDRRDRARDEAEAALAAFRELGASLGAAAAADFIAQLDGRPRRPAGLTARELEVLGLLAQGLTNREIAGRLVVSDHTVHRHVANILRKVGQPSRAAAAAWAARERVV